MGRESNFGSQGDERLRERALLWGMDRHQLATRARAEGLTPEDYLDKLDREEGEARRRSFRLRRAQDRPVTRTPENRPEFDPGMRVEREPEPERTEHVVGEIVKDSDGNVRIRHKKKGQAINGEKFAVDKNGAIAVGQGGVLFWD